MGVIEKFTKEMIEKLSKDELWKVCLNMYDEGSYNTFHNVCQWLRQHGDDYAFTKYGANGELTDDGVLYVESLIKNMEKELFKEEK